MKRTILSVVGVIVIAGGYLAFNYFTGAALGEPCYDNTSCKGNIHGKFGSQCLQDDVGSFCTVRCDTVADCPPGWTCEIVSMIDVSTGMETGETNQVCARPIPGQPMPGQPVPGQPVPGQPAPQPVPQPTQ
jgi:hypothetical protein